MAATTENGVSRNILSPRLIWLVLIVGLALRLYGLSWDDGYYFHPDERQLLIVADRISLARPPDLPLLLTPDSPWNPRFFAYGSLPIYLFRLCADLAGRLVYDYGTLHSGYLVGRALSALFDVGTIWLIFRLGRRLFGVAEALLAAGLVALTVLHIQLAHFYTTDTMLVFFAVLVVSQAVEVAKEPVAGRAWGIGLAWGMALATKFSAVLLAFPVAAAWLLGEWARAPSTGRWIWHAAWRCALTMLIAGGSLILFQPYTVIDPMRFLTDIAIELRIAGGLDEVPYTLQFHGTTPYLYPLRQMAVWGMGPMLGMAALLALPAGLAYAVRMAAAGWRRRGTELLVPLIWVVAYFAVVGGAHTRFTRYMLPVIPFLCLWAARGLVVLLRARGAWSVLGMASTGLVIGGAAFYALAFMNIYRQEHPWLQASRWICRNLPQGSRVMIEHWDDPLPIWHGRGDLRCHRNYQYNLFRAYDRDDTAKLDHLLQALEESDYIILSSRRLYGSIPRMAERYPLTSEYYALLMTGALGFEPVYHVAVYPTWAGIRLEDDPFAAAGLPRPVLADEDTDTWLRIRLGAADESMIVYDHPMPLIFQRVRRLSRQEILERLGASARYLPPPPLEWPDS